VPFSSPDFVRHIAPAEQAAQVHDTMGGASPLRAQRGTPAAPGQVQRAPIFRDPTTGALTGDTAWLSQKPMSSVAEGSKDSARQRRKRASRRSRVVSQPTTGGRPQTFSQGRPDFSAEEQYPWDDSTEAPAVHNSGHVPGRTVWTPPNRVRRQDRPRPREEERSSPPAPTSAEQLTALLEAIEGGSPAAQQLLREVRREVDRLRAMDSMRKY
jgi:hypothetical protein